MLSISCGGRNGDLGDLVEWKLLLYLRGDDMVLICDKYNCYNLDICYIEQRLTTDLWSTAQLGEIVPWPSSSQLYPPELRCWSWPVSLWSHSYVRGEEGVYVVSGSVSVASPWHRHNITLPPSSDNIATASLLGAKNLLFALIPTQPSIFCHILSLYDPYNTSCPHCCCHSTPKSCCQLDSINNIVTSW